MAILIPNAQEWLTNKYSNKETTEAIVLKEEEQLIGELIIKDYPNLRKILVSGTANSSEGLNKLEIVNCPQVTELRCGYNKLTNLDLSNLTNLTHLRSVNNQLATLDLRNNPYLTILFCQKNELTSLDISNCQDLTRIDCSENQLTNFNFLANLNPEKVTLLIIRNNNFPPTDLAFFSNWVNLEDLRVNKGFYGNLECLKGLTNLKTLWISWTNINEGLEHLPESVKKIYCYYTNASNTKCKTIIKQLEPYQVKKQANEYYYDYQAWRKDKISAKKIKEFQGLQTTETKLNEQLNNVQKELKKTNLLTPNSTKNQLKGQLTSIQAELKQIQEEKLNYEQYLDRKKEDPTKNYPTEQQLKETEEKLKKLQEEHQQSLKLLQVLGEKTEELAKEKDIIQKEKNDLQIQLENKEEQLQAKEKQIEEMKILLNTTFSFETETSLLEELKEENQLAHIQIPSKN